MPSREGDILEVRKNDSIQIQQRGCFDIQELAVSPTFYGNELIVLTFQPFYYIQLLSICL